MPIFRNLKGDFFNIPEAHLKNFKLSAEEAKRQLQRFELAGTEIFDTSEDDVDVIGQHQATLVAPPLNISPSK
jgi:hypothetical protein